MKVSIELEKEELHDEGLTGLMQAIYRTESKQWILDYLKSKIGAVMGKMEERSTDISEVKTFAETLIYICDDLDQYIDGQLRLEVEGEKIQTFENFSN